MNAPTALSHLIPAIQQRDVPAAFLEALQTRFGAQLSTTQAVREQHGRDESSFTAPPPAAVVFAHSTRSSMILNSRCRSFSWAFSVGKRSG